MEIKGTERGKKDAKDKLRTDLVPYEWGEALAEVLTFGADKYGDHNWKKGIPYSELIGAAERHILAFKKGEQQASDSQLHHLAHAVVDLLMVMYYDNHSYTRFDDRKEESTWIKALEKSLFQQ